MKEFFLGSKLSHICHTHNVRYVLLRNINVIFYPFMLNGSKSICSNGVISVCVYICVHNFLPK